MYLWSSGVLISRHPRFHLVPPQGLVQFSELYEKHTCLWLQRSYLKRKRPAITCGQDAVLLRIPFVETESFGGREEVCASASPALGRRPAASARPGRSPQNGSVLFCSASLIAKCGHKTAGGTCVFMVLSPRKHPKWQSRNPHLDPRTHAAAGPVGI